MCLQFCVFRLKLNLRLGSVEKLLYRCGYEAELLGKYCRRLQAGSVKGVGTAAAGMGPAVAS